MIFSSPLIGNGYPGLEQVVWPENLDTLSFGERFQQSLEGVAWPSALQSLVFGKDFNQSLEDVTWPASLQNLGMTHNSAPFQRD